MIGILLAAITIQVWIVLLLITIFSFVLAFIADSQQSGYFLFPTALLGWLILNLIMWLLYFIIV